MNVGRKNLIATDPVKFTRKASTFGSKEAQGQPISGGGHMPQTTLYGFSKYLLSRLNVGPLHGWTGRHVRHVHPHGHLQAQLGRCPLRQAHVRILAVQMERWNAAAGDLLAASAHSGRLKVTVEGWAAEFASRVVGETAVHAQGHVLEGLAIQRRESLPAIWRRCQQACQGLRNDGRCARENGRESPCLANHLRPVPQGVEKTRWTI